MVENSDGKSVRLLTIYSRLANGEILNKSQLAQEFHVTERSVQRDMEDLRTFVTEQMLMQEIIYDPKAKGYRLANSVPKSLTNSEILAVSKILLESRSMRRDEMMPILDKLIACCVPAENRKAVGSLIANERYHYVEPHHQKYLLPGLWEIGLAIQQQNVMEIEYEKLGKSGTVHRVIEPVGLLFSEYYFYLAAFIRNIDRENFFENPDDLFPTIYRLDRIQSFHVLEEHFRVPYKDRFEEGEFRKRVQFMYGGKLQQIKFRYTGPSIEAVLDRLPTAQIIQQDEAGWVIAAEVFGKGIEMWLRSQGDYISIVDT
ncbi:WYL domain-containing protein [Pseudoflavonifractor sp. CLA-AP-H29]|uniref:WYL domain-containing protein n=1 Tax=Pseudoflavonifractor intestinihominis TaxID=3133171 RepID=A0ABV1E9E0_9FIRM